MYINECIMYICMYVCLYVHIYIGIYECTYVGVSVAICQHIYPIPFLILKNIVPNLEKREYTPVNQLVQVAVTSVMIKPFCSYPCLKINHLIR